MPLSRGVLPQTSREGSGAPSVEQDVSMSSRTAYGFNKVMPVGNGEAGSFSYSSQKRRVVCGGKRHWILNPTKPPRLTWDSIIFVLVLYNSLLIPLTLSFSNFLENDVLTALSRVDNVIDVLFVVDIVLNFFTSFMDNRGELVRSHKAIAMRYLSTFFAIDVIAAFPFDYLQAAFEVDDQVNAATRWLPLLKLPRLLRLSRLLRFLDRFEFANVWKIIRLLFFFVLIAHFIACIWHLLVENDSEWWAAGLYNLINSSSVAVSHEAGADQSFSTEGLTLLDAYTLCLYSAFIMLMGSDVFPHTAGQRLFASGSMILGAMFSAIVFGSMALLITNFNAANTRFNQQMDEVNTTMRYLGLPPLMQKKIRSYFEYMYHTQKDISGHHVFSSLNPTVRYEIASHLHRKMVKEAPLFQACHPFFIKDIVTRLKAEIYMSGDTIIQEGDTGQEMYFISHGRVEILMKEKKMTELGPGAFFGEIALLLRSRRTAAARAKTICELQVLRKDDFNTVLLKYPLHKQRFVELAQKRKQQQSEHNDKKLIDDTFRRTALNEDERTTKRFKKRLLKSTDASWTSNKLSAAQALEVNSLVDGDEDQNVEIAQDTAKRAMPKKGTTVFFRECSTISNAGETDMIMDTTRATADVMGDTELKHFRPSMRLRLAVPENGEHSVRATHVAGRRSPGHDARSSARTEWSAGDHLVNDSSWIDDPSLSGRLDGLALTLMELKHLIKAQGKMTNKRLQRLEEALQPEVAVESTSSSCSQMD